MRTRTLHAIAAGLIATGLSTATAGLHPRVPDTAIRAGVLLVIAALPLIVAAQGRRAADARADQIAAARNAGYRLGLLHAACGLLAPTDGGTPTGTTRGHLRSVHADYDPPQRQAQ